MIKLDPTITAQFSELINPPTHAKLFHRTVRVHDPAEYQMPPEWFSIEGTFIQAGYLLGTLDATTGKFIPTPAKYSPPIQVLVDPTTPAAAALLAPGIAPTTQVVTTAAIATTTLLMPSSNSDALVPTLVPIPGPPAPPQVVTQAVGAKPKNDCRITDIDAVAILQDPHRLLGTVVPDPLN